MRRRLVIIGSVLVLLAVVVVAVVTNQPSERRAGTSIVAADGVRLAAKVMTPSASSGRFPLIVMPASWGSGASQYATVGASLASAGYVVVAYAQRGFEGSGGEIDLAGPATQRDVSSVVTWALSHTLADPERIGAVGISYGAGASLLAAARDPRIRAVVALSGWADLAAALAPGGALNVWALEALLRTSGVAKHASPELKSLGAALLADDTAAATRVLTSLSASRSAVRGVAALNRNRTAVMLAHAYQDSIFSPSSLIPFFSQLTGPKRLQLESGDHGGPERPALSGGESRVWTDARAWLDRYVKGSRSSAASEPVRLRDVRTGEWHGYPSWRAVGRVRILSLGNPGSGAAIASSREPSWTARITGGVDTSADSGLAQFAAAAPYTPPTAQVGAISPTVALTWNSPRLPQTTLVNGSCALRFTVASSSPGSVLVAYLYDVDASGTGSLLAEQPHLLSAGPGRSSPVSVELPPVSWTIAAGHHLTVVVDTVDPRYAPTPASTTLTFSSTAAHPASLDVPLG